MSAAELTASDRDLLDFIRALPPNFTFTVKRGKEGWSVHAEDHQQAGGSALGRGKSLDEAWRGQGEFWRSRLPA